MLKLIIKVEYGLWKTCNRYLVRLWKLPVSSKSSLILISKLKMLSIRKSILVFK